MPQYADDRFDKAQALLAKNQQIAGRHRARQARAMAKGDTDAALVALTLAERAERLAKVHAINAEHLELAASRARGARRQTANQNADRTLTEAVQAAAAPDPEPELSPKEAARRARQEEKRQRMLRQADAAMAKDRQAAGVSTDNRTAAAQREIVVSNARDVSGKRGSLAEYGVLIRNQSDRTGPRIAAIRQFDELCHRAFAGLLPEPRFEPGVDTSAGPAGVTDARIAGLTEMQNLTRRIGDEAQALLFHRVFERRTFTWMSGQGFGDERALAVMFLSAVDGTARFYGLADRSRSVGAMEARLDNVGF